jgi:hypothetical protein
MATRIYSITNVTTQDAQLLNKEAPSDSTPINTLTIAHTGGKDGDYSKIPDCSDAKYFDAHHMYVTATDGSDVWTIAFWNNDAQNHQLYYSLDGTYASGQAIQGSTSWVGVNMMISLVDAINIHFFPY